MGKRPESRALFKAIRYRHILNWCKRTAIIKVDLPESWLREKTRCRKKIFGKKIAKKYAMALACDIALHQDMFWGKKDYWFQPLCEKLGWDITDQFKDRFRIILFVVCVDENL